MNMVITAHILWDCSATPYTSLLHVHLRFSFRPWSGNMSLQRKTLLTKGFVQITTRRMLQYHLDLHVSRHHHEQSLVKFQVCLASCRSHWSENTNLWIPWGGSNMETNVTGKQQNESTHSFSQPFITTSTLQSNIINKKAKTPGRNKKQDSTSNTSGHWLEDTGMKEWLNGRVEGGVVIGTSDGGVVIYGAKDGIIKRAKGQPLP